MRGAVIGFVVLGVAALSLWWLVHPPRTDEEYRKRAAQTAESLRSHVATARLWAREVDRRRVTRGAAAVALEESSTGANSSASTFESWVPPEDLNRLRAVVTDVASTTTSVLGELHVAAEQDEWKAVAAAQPRLRELEVRLIEVASEARP